MWYLEKMCHFIKYIMALIVNPGGGKGVKMLFFNVWESCRFQKTGNIFVRLKNLRRFVYLGHLIGMFYYQKSTRKKMSYVLLLVKSFSFLHAPFNAVSAHKYTSCIYVLSYIKHDWHILHFQWSNTDRGAPILQISAAIFSCPHRGTTLKIVVFSQSTAH